MLTIELLCSVLRCLPRRRRRLRGVRLLLWVRRRLPWLLEGLWGVTWHRHARRKVLPWIWSVEWLRYTWSKVDIGLRYGRRGLLLDGVQLVGGVVADRHRSRRSGRIWRHTGRCRQGRWIVRHFWGV